MGLASLLFGKTAKQSSDSDASRLAAATREQTRRELITMAVRDTLKRHGLSADCITAEGLPSIVAGRHRGMQVQLVVKEWQPHLLSYVLALEAAFRSRLLRLDPLSSSWISGVSWRFEPKEPDRWPQLPANARRSPASAQPAAKASRSGTEALEELLQSGDGAFSAKAGRNGGDFSPTVPMQIT